MAAMVAKERFERLGAARAFYLAERRSPQSRVLVLRDRSATLGHYKFSVAIELASVI